MDNEFVDEEQAEENVVSFSNRNSSPANKEKSKQKPKVKLSEINAIRISGVRRNSVMFRANVNSVVLIRLIPVNSWQGGNEQSFLESEFRAYPKPTFANN